MTSQIESLCNEILTHLTALGRPVVSLLQPGLAESDIDCLVGGLPFVLPLSVVDMYKWRNGTRNAVGMDFFPGYGFVPLSQAVEYYHALIGSSTWTDHWFPVFRSGGADFFAVCCSDSASEDGQVVHDLNEIGAEAEFVSLEAMLRTLLRAYETEVYYVDEDGGLTFGVETYFQDGPFKGSLEHVDTSRFKEVARKFNPGLKCWQ